MLTCEDSVRRCGCELLDDHGKEIGIVQRDIDLKEAGTRIGHTGQTQLAGVSMRDAYPLRVVAAVVEKVGSAPHRVAEHLLRRVGRTHRPVELLEEGLALLKAGSGSTMCDEAENGQSTIPSTRCHSFRREGC